MSNRTLIEVNHDEFRQLESPEFAEVLGRYLRSASHEHAKVLERFGARVVGMRHHSNKFIIHDGEDGFPPLYLKASGKADAA